MSDFEIWAPDNATMIAAAQATTGLWSAGARRPNAEPGLVTGGVSADGIVWALNYYGQKYAPTGNTVLDRHGNSIAEMAPLPGMFANLRWLGDPALIPPVPAGAPVTIRPLPADAPFGFAS